MWVYFYDDFGAPIRGGTQEELVDALSIEHIQALGRKLVVASRCATNAHAHDIEVAEPAGSYLNVATKGVGGIMLNIGFGL